MRRWGLLLVLVLVLALPACGKKSIPKNQYLQRGNAICTQMNAQGSTLPDPGQDPQKLLAVVQQAIPITANAVSQLRALPQPSGDQATLRSFYSKMDAVVSGLRQEAAALEANDLQRAQNVANTLDTATKAANDAANAYGLTVCGQA